VPWVLELGYPTVGSLRTEIDTQLGLGGLYLDAEVPEACGDALRLRLCAPEVEAIELPVRITDRSEGSVCIELDEDAAMRLRGDAAAWDPAAAESPRVSFVDEADAPSEDKAPVHERTLAQKIAVMSIGEKLQLAAHGQRDARAMLMRERAGPVQTALIKNPRISIDEITALARGPALAPDTAEVLMQHPTFGSSASIVLALVRNPRTPVPIATQMVNKLGPADLRTIAKGIGVRAQVAAAARKRLNA
jgi:hypothetical protein